MEHMEYRRRRVSKIWQVILVAAVLGLGVLSLSFYKKNSDLQKLATARNTELMKANLDLGRAHTKIGDANALVSKLGKRIRQEIKAREAAVASYGELQLKYEAEKKKVKTLTKIVYKDRTTEKVVDLPKKKLFMRQDDGTYKEITSLLYSYKDFRIVIEGDAVKQTLSYKLTQRFRGQLVETHLPTGGKNHYATFYELDEKGKDIGKLKLEKFEVIRSEDLPRKMMWWNPKLDLAVGGGVTHKLDGIWLADVAFSLSAYGRTSDDLLWRFFRVGAGLTNNGFSLTFSPVQFNLGKHLPLISNIWLTPYGGYDFGSGAGQTGLMVGVVF
jgi:hypothetical protein